MEIIACDAATVDITPPSGLQLAGYAARSLPAVGALDPLEANLLLMKGAAGAEVLVVTLDVLAITAPLKETLTLALEAVTGVTYDAIRLVASHTHAAPLAWTGEIHPILPGEVNREEIDRVVRLVIDAAVRLDPRPCRLEWSVTEVTGAGTNRHSPDGPHERTAGVLGVKRLEGQRDGEMIAIVYDYACHPTTLGPDNLSWSADWVGAARKGLRAAVGPLPVLYLPGAAGDVSTRFGRTGRAGEVTAEVGAKVAMAVEAGLKSGHPITGPLDVAHATLAVPTRSLDEGMGKTAPIGSTRLDESKAEGRAAARALSRSGLPEVLSVPISWLAVGPARWLFLSVEPFAAFGQLLASPELSTRVVGYTDAYHGYMPDSDTYDAGHYEASAALVDEATAAMFYHQCTEKCLEWQRGRPVPIGQPARHRAVDGALGSEAAPRGR